MKRIRKGFAFSGSGEILKATGLVVATQTAVPIDKKRAEEEEALEKKFGRDVFGVRIPEKFLNPEKYFNIFPDDSQAKLGTI